MFGGSATNKTPLPPLRGYFPQREKIKRWQILPLWGKWPEGPMGALFSVFRFPREGGDPARRSKFTFVQFGAVRERAVLVV